MIRSLRSYVGRQYGLIAALRRTDNQQELTKFYSRSSNSLVIMPEDIQSAELALSVVRFLEKQFHGRNCIVVAASQPANLVSKYTNVEVVRYSDKDVNYFFLPKKHFLNRFSKRPYDLVLDLNIGFVLFAAYLSMKVASRYRVSFAKEFGDKFYNIQYRYIAGQSKQLTYNSLCNFLERF